MKYLYTKYEHYKSFCEENGTDRICKGIKITTNGGKISGLLKYITGYVSEEIFNEPIKTEYEFLELSNVFKKILFHSKSGTKYRIDIHIINEMNRLVNHISFTEEDSKLDIIPNNDSDFIEYEINYNKSTNRNEMIEVLDRIRYILFDLVSNNKLVSDYFCIGGTEFKRKNNIYEYFLEVVVGKDGFKKLKTNVYPQVGWGLYFKI